jgi:hypothetical protein
MRVRYVWRVLGEKLRNTHLSASLCLSVCSWKFSSLITSCWYATILVNRLKDWKKKSKSGWKLCYDQRSVGQSVLVQNPVWGPRPVFCYCQTVVGLLMWGALSDERTDLSLVYTCCWSSSAQSFSGLAGLMIIFYCLRLETPPTWRAMFPYLYPQGTKWPSYTPQALGLILRLAGLRWTYSNPPPRWRKDWLLKLYIKITLVPHRKHSISPLISSSD